MLHLLKDGRLAHYQVHALMERFMRIVSKGDWLTEFLQSFVGHYTLQQWLQQKKFCYNREQTEAFFANIDTILASGKRWTDTAVSVNTKCSIDTKCMLTCESARLAILADETVGALSQDFAYEEICGISPFKNKHKRTIATCHMHVFVNLMDIVRHIRRGCSHAGQH